MTWLLEESYFFSYLKAYTVKLLRFIFSFIKDTSQLTQITQGHFNVKIITKNFVSNVTNSGFPSFSYILTIFTRTYLASFCSKTSRNSFTLTKINHIIYLMSVLSLSLFFSFFFFGGGGEEYLSVVYLIDLLSY